MSRSGLDQFSVSSYLYYLYLCAYFVWKQTPMNCQKLIIEDVSGLKRRIYKLQIDLKQGGLLFYSNF